VVDVVRKKAVVIQPSTEKTLDEAFSHFIQARRALNASEETIKYYRREFKCFLEFFGEGRQCAEVNSGTLLEYLDYLREEKPDLAEKTVQTYIKGLRVIFYYFMQNEWMEEFKITLPRAEETIKEVYTDYEVAQLIKKPNLKTCNFTELRNWAMVCYFLSTGNRLSTVASIRVSDVRLQDGEIFIRKTKQKKQYIIPISSGLKEVLQEYLRYRKGGPDDFLFCSVYGEQFTKDTMGEVLRLYNNSRGVEKTGIHLFRHTFAKNWIMNGGDIFRLQKVLGHSTLDMVKQYANLYGADLKRDYDQFSLFDRAKASGEQHKTQQVKMRK
jgi:integrase/recombinase XerD